MMKKKLIRYRAGRNAATLRYLEWDSGIFGFKIGRIENIRLVGGEKANRDLIDRIMRDCRKARYRHINCRIDIKDLAALRALERNGFNVADIQITLSTRSKPVRRNAALSGFSIVKASENDLGQIRCITRDAFTDTRVVQDLNYPRERVDKFYYEWVKNSVYNKRQAVFLAKENGSEELAGFVICDVLNGIGFIDLISVNRRKRGCGIGSALVGAAMNWFSGNSGEAEVRTQISNIAAIEAFTKGGFKFITPGNILPAGISMHYWFEKG